MELKIIYVAGQGHSGTTLLDLACSSHNSAVSLGEIQASVRCQMKDMRDTICSCGSSAMECSFWGALLSEFDALSIGERYDAVVARAAALFGDRSCVIDSSKTIAGLRTASRYFPFVLHMSKDMRAYVISQIDRAAKLNQARPRAIDEAISWWRQNERVTKAISELGLQSLDVGYEELCLSPKSVAQRINDFVGAALVDPENLLGSKSHHILHGNGMRISHGGVIRYDQKWLGRSEWLMPYFVLRKGRRLNESRYRRG